MRNKETISAAQTEEIAAEFSQLLAPNTVIAFTGDLGAGKTTFIRGLAKAFKIDAREICSPTFNYLNIYQGTLTIYHFDLYRIPSVKEFTAAGFDEYLQCGGICCIEWSEKIEEILPKDTIRVHFTYLGQEERKIEISFP